MQEINVTIQNSLSPKIVPGRPNEHGIVDATIFVSFVRRQIHIIAWIEAEHPNTETTEVCRQLLRIAEYYANAKAAIV